MQRIAKHAKFVDALREAQGRSEFVITAVADIRGFSDFSTRNESPDIAMFIKRFYLQLIEKYFPSANFVKPTGDGLLMTFSYSEKDLYEVARDVIEACITCVADFPTICANDPMINFQVPQAIGFGIARGTACCLFSGSDILDYSGHLLNLTARLNDLARPSGVVIDGDFLRAVIPESVRTSFKEQQVYIRGIAEEAPISVFYLDNAVQISEQALSPLRSENWVTVVRQYTRSALGKLSSHYRIQLDAPVKSKDKLRITVSFRRKGFRSVVDVIRIKPSEYNENEPLPEVMIDVAEIRAALEAAGTPQNAKITIKLEYVPRSLTRK